MVAALRATQLGGDTLSWQDVLCEGPVPALPPADLRKVRAGFLAEHGWGEAEIVQALERRDRLFADALADRPQVVLWFEHDLFDQLQLLQVLARADELGFDPARLELINVGSFEGKPSFAGLGELDSPELESLWPLRRPVLVEQAKLASAGWAAVSEADPTAVERFLETDTSALARAGGSCGRWRLPTSTASQRRCANVRRDPVCDHRDRPRRSRRSGGPDGSPRDRPLGRRHTSPAGPCPALGSRAEACRS